ncbi:hypothetical protein FRIGORI9N_70072 [Frigoribacterium sp. 9N]|nr:hypothetical protein FRIGORI9N_70072 [Frigoribacterium sp. 9N]
MGNNKRYCLLGVPRSDGGDDLEMFRASVCTGLGSAHLKPPRPAEPGQRTTHRVGKELVARQPGESHVEVPAVPKPALFIVPVGHVDERTQSGQFVITCTLDSKSNSCGLNRFPVLHHGPNLGQIDRSDLPPSTRSLSKPLVLQPHQSSSDRSA